MSNLAKYIAIYTTSIARPKIKSAFVEPVKMKFFKGGSAIQVPITRPRVYPVGARMKTDGKVGFFLPPGDYFSLSIETDIEQAGPAQDYCDLHLNQAIATLALILDPNLFTQCVYRGWVVTNHVQIGGSWVKCVKPIDIESTLEEVWAEAVRAQSNDAAKLDRFRLMSKFLAKALAMPPSDEAFIYLYTVLEIWPMQEVTKIFPVWEELSRHTGVDRNVVKERLKLGHLCDQRGKLLHRGALPLTRVELAEAIMRLQAICLEVMRAMIGLKYEGSLDCFLVEGFAQEILALKVDPNTFELTMVPL